MGFFGKKTPSIDWAVVAGRMSGILVELLNHDPGALSKQYARFVLRSDGNVGMFFDERNPKYILGHGDVAFVFIRQNTEFLKHWVEELKSSHGSPMFQRAATEAFAKTLVNEMRGQLE